MLSLSMIRVDPISFEITIPRGSAQVEEFNMMDKTVKELYDYVFELIIRREVKELAYYSEQDQATREAAAAWYDR